MTARGRRFPLFDSLRAIGALSVLAFHVCVTSTLLAALHLESLNRYAAHLDDHRQGQPQRNYGQRNPVLMTAASLGVAALSYYVVERPALKLRTLVRDRRATADQPGAASAPASAPEV